MNMLFHFKKALVTSSLLIFIFLLSSASAAVFPQGGTITIPLNGSRYSANNKNGIWLIEAPSSNSITSSKVGDYPPPGGCVFRSRTGVFHINTKASEGGDNCHAGTPLSSLSGHRFIIYFYQPTIHRHAVDGSIVSRRKGRFIDNGTMIETTPYTFIYRKHKDFNFSIEGYQISNKNFGKYFGLVHGKAM